MATLNEVAQRVGCTPATVSNVLRNRGRVGDLTRQRVLEAIEALNYRPHLAARALAEGRAPTIALMVSSIANPFYPEFALAVERAARMSGQFLIICNTNDDPVMGRAYLEQIAGTLSEGVLVTNANLDFVDLQNTEARGTPVVLCMWERPLEPPGLPCVAVDFRLAGQLAGQHLLELGHRRLGVIVGSKVSGVHVARQDGFFDALRSAGVDPAGIPVLHASDTSAGGYQATRELLEARPDLTAIFATNDLPALGALHAAADLGLDVPRDLSVIGITDIQLAREARPSLTTVAVPSAEAAELAVMLLRDLIEKVPHDGGQEPCMRVASAPRIVVRNTTWAPRLGGR
ncbi:LacI family DNA-binding transcriptional regulator [Burkholderia vietnamiensis]|uniref:LacI family DNA-binding transcriptional regulator n=1 Tax=Burkholderia vietnamiensis TaxID=60552 RepID=A0AAW7SYM6_BURVI|nr:LacI family DNA-binding transcriptional regulator [Burkholderia vietnamiensis]MBH9645794.1 LacI family DNA-binding transcriptional regulator [Burkholderia vietnamiensis]MBR8008932.1 LacI family DNA-binding transcriptional regulator [Burkholderia vietnamiensis]MDN7551248.1 LacI family DNA-binding transcriptional regulator [Burkholderia vietnamiensis]MDN7795062.1 LacI family DNA-binding transcriptional regulator [Burkholderia vietnamiensis]MDN8044439.1 LacI family DNA-binding transcriptional 